MKRKSTMIELVSDLEALPERSVLIRQILDEARAGEFHDYKNKKYLCGKVELVHLLMRAQRDESLSQTTRTRLRKLAQAVKEGEFDEEADAEDQEMLQGIMKDMAKEVTKVNGLPAGATPLFKPPEGVQFRMRAKFGIGSDDKYYFDFWLAALDGTPLTDKINVGSVETKEQAEKVCRQVVDDFARMTNGKIMRDDASN